MKKIKYFLMLIMISMLLTGCIKFNATMDIKKDKSMDFSIIYAFDKTVFGEEMSLKEEDMAEVKKQGFTVNKYSEGNFEGFTISKKIKNIDEVSTESDAEYDLSGLMDEKTENKYIFKVVKGNDKNIYYAKLKFDSKDSGLNDEASFDDEKLADEISDGSNSLNDMDLSKMMANLDLKFNVKLPNAALSSNATEKSSDNKNLSWKLNTEGTEYIEFAFELSNNASTGFNMLYVGIGALVAIAIVAVVIVLSKKKNSPTNVVDNNQNTNN